MPIVKCRCGQSLKVEEDTERFRCPRCDTLLQTKARPTSSGGRSVAAASGASASQPGDRVRLKCPCGGFATVSNGQQIGTCESCGTKLRQSQGTTQADASETQSEPQVKANQRNPGSTHDVAPALASTMEFDPLPNPAQSSLKETTSWNQQASPRQTVRQKTRVRNRRAGTSTPPAAKWRIPAAAAVVALLVLGGAGFLVITSQNKSDQTVSDANTESDSVNATADDAAASRDTAKATSVAEIPSADSEMVRIGTYPPGPRLPYTREFLEKDFIETLRYPIGKYVSIVPPEKNAAPEYISALARLDEDLAKILPDDRKFKRQESARNLTRLLEELKGMQLGVDADVRNGLRQFDLLFDELVQAQMKPEFSLFAVPNLEQTALLSRALSRLKELSALRIAEFVDRNELDLAIREIRVLDRLGNEVGKDATMGIVLSGNIKRSVWADSLSLILNSPNLDSDHTQTLLEVLLPASNAQPSESLERSFRVEQLWPLTLMFDVERSSPAERKKYARQLVLLTRFTKAKLSQEEETRVNLFHGLLVGMKDRDFEVNRNAYIDYVEGAIEASAGSLERVIKRFPEWERGEREKRVEENKQAKAALKDGDLNSVPWLAQMLVPMTTSLVELETMSLALERVAAVQTALKHAELIGQPVSEDLSRLPKIVSAQLNVTDPYSGEPLKVAVIGGVPAVYSVGPDGTDDLAGFVTEKPNDPGDIYILQR